MSSLIRDGGVLTSMSLTVSLVSGCSRLVFQLYISAFFCYVCLVSININFNKPTLGLNNVTVCSNL